MPGWEASSNNPANFDFDEVDDGAASSAPETPPAESRPEKTESSAPPREGGEQRSEPAQTGAGFDAALLDRARQFGLSAEEAKGFESPAALKRALDFAERRSTQRSDTGQPPERAPRTDAPPPPAEKKERPRINLGDFDEIDKAFSEFDPSVQKLAKHTRAIAERLNAALDELDARDQREQQLLGKVTAHEQDLMARRQEALYDEFDGALASLGSDWEPLFGKGGRHDLAPDGSEIKERSKIWDDVLIQAAGFQAAGRPIPDLKTLVRRAVRAIHGERSETETTIPKDKVKQQLRDRETGQFVARPTHRESPRNGKNLTDKDRTQNAQAFVNKFYSERGLQEPEIDDGF